MEKQNLVKRAKCGDEEAFVQLMDAQTENMYKIAKSILRNDEDAADVMAETVLTCWEKLDTLKKDSYFKTWLIRILMNKCYDLIRERERLAGKDQVQEQSSWEKGYERAEWEMVMQFLDEKYRLVLLLYYVENLKIREIGQILQLPLSTVKTRLVRGRRQLAAELKQEERRGKS